MKRYNTVDEYITAAEDGRELLIYFRQLLLQTELEETVKWGAPIYTLDGSNIIGLAVFKSYVGLWFHQGVFLEDKAKVLFNAQEGKTKALRQWRFDFDEEVDEVLLKSYINEAIANQKAGKVVKPTRNTNWTLNTLLATALDTDETLKKAFELLTNYKQKEYSQYIDEAKREPTKLKRIDKIIPMIKAGQGLNDKYKK